MRGRHVTTTRAVVAGGASTVLSVVVFFVLNLVANNVDAFFNDETVLRGQQEKRKLNYDVLAGYEPSTLVTNQAAIDLDQAEMEYQLSHHELDKFRYVYEQGGHSSSIARLTLTGVVAMDDDEEDDGSDKNEKKLLLPPPVYEIPKNTEVIGWTKDKQLITGQLYEPLKPWKEGENTATILVEYKSNLEQSNYLQCQVGGLAYTDSTNVDGCFAESSSIQILDLQRDAPPYHYTYSYTVNKDNYNERTIQGMSISAKQMMYEDCNEHENGKGSCPYEEYMKFVHYYNSYTYADEFVQAALDGRSTVLSHGIDFTNYKEHIRGESIRLTTKYMHIWMYVIGTMEQAINECYVECGRRCDDLPIRSWDSAAAYYIGSLEKENGEGKGYLLYDLADRTCPTFRTCSKNEKVGSDDFGTANVNTKILQEFQDGQLHLFKRQCDLANGSKERIIALMRVPLIQATIYLAYMRHYYPADNDDDADVDEVKSAIMAATILPVVHDCNKDDASTIQENMQLRRTDFNQTVDFVAVKEAFENNYECMGIACSDVGGVWDNGEYGELASPCGIKNFETEFPEKSVILVTMFGVISFVGIIVFLLLMIQYNRKMKNYGRDDKFSEADDFDIPDNLSTVDLN